MEHAAALLRSVRIAGFKDSVTDTVAPLHWLIADKGGSCMTVEKTADGIRLTDNPIGVLSNSPDFQWHMENLRNYMGIAPTQQKATAWESVVLTPFGQGAGTFGLPGDFTPPSRFVRAAYLKSHIRLSGSRDEAVTDCFHILENISIPKGCVITDRGTSDYTQYLAVISLSSCEYYIKTYNGGRIMRERLAGLESAGKEIISHGKPLKPVSFDRLSEESPFPT